MTGVSTIGAGAMGYETAKTWKTATPLQRTMGVTGTILYSLPILITTARSVKISADTIPTIEHPEGKRVWKGLSVANNPVIGKSDGRWVIGARDITLPEADMILNGYKPEMMLETKVFTNEVALQKAGFTQTQIDYLTTSLKDRNLFAGKSSPFLSKEALIEPTARLDADDVSTLLKQINKYNEDIKQVDLLYGSSTIKSQLAPELREWRQVHDWDIQTH